MNNDVINAIKDYDSSASSRASTPAKKNSPPISKRHALVKRESSLDSARSIEKFDKIFGNMKSPTKEIGRSNRGDRERDDNISQDSSFDKLLNEKSQKNKKAIQSQTSDKLQDAHSKDDKKTPSLFSVSDDRQNSSSLFSKGIFNFLLVLQWAGFVFK